MTFKFVDLFAGIGGFHGALSALGGECVYASEIDRQASLVYLRNWGIQPAGDITQAANDSVMDVPNHDVLVGGFPCQPFSKSGKQKGMDEARGTLFWNIARIIEVRKPKLVLLENVRNIAGPRHAHEWEIIIKTLRELGYRVSSVPFVVSPHKIHPVNGGRPQVRERVLICATKIPSQTRHLHEEPGLPNMTQSYSDWNPMDWKLATDLPLESGLKSKQRSEYSLSEQELLWLECWGDFVDRFRKNFPKEKLPGFPIWVDDWIESNHLVIKRGIPKWKSDFLRKNSEFYTAHQKVLDKWLKDWNGLADFPPSRRKFEWQAQETKSISQTLVHFRPSGIRCKSNTYAPALVAITQTTVVPSKKRKLTIREAARLQGFPEWFDFLDQANGITYKQLGNAVNIGVIYNVLKAQVLRDIDLLENDDDLVQSILSAPLNPDARIAHFGDTLKHEIKDHNPISKLKAVN
nr:DNA cytosine methyltransferase [Candidatus Nanopelagicales bacterium]